MGLDSHSTVKHFLSGSQVWSILWLLETVCDVLDTDTYFYKFYTFPLKSSWQEISLWIMDQPYLGHKAPRPGRGRLYWCPACRTPTGPGTPLSSRHSLTWYIMFYLSSRHVLQDCPMVETTRFALGIRHFLDGCHQVGFHRLVKDFPLFF